MSINKASMFEELMDTCKKLNIEPNHILISHGGASLVYDMREYTGDIDVEVLDVGDWNILKFIYPNNIKHYPALGRCSAVDAIAVGNIDFHHPRGAFGLQGRETIIVNGFHISSQKQLLVERIKLGREKDMDDIHKLVALQLAVDDEYKAKLHELLNTQWDK